MTPLLKVFQNAFKVIYRDQTTIETSTFQLLAFLRDQIQVLANSFSFSFSYSFCDVIISKLDKKGSKLYILCRDWWKDRNKYLMKHWSEDFVSDITFSKSYSFNSRGDVINPKLGQKWPWLLFHVQIVIERWKSTVKENLRWGFHFWNQSLRILKFWLPLPPWWGHQPKNGSKKSKLVFHVPILIERWKSKLKGTLSWNIRL